VLKERVLDLDFWVFFFPELLIVGLVTTSKLRINNCNFGFQEPTSAPCSTEEWIKLSLISPIDTDSVAPCICHKLTEYIAMES
jgi:hypothetical protein